MSPNNVPTAIKREVVRDHFELMAKEARAAAAKSVAWALYVEHRATLVGGMTDMELDLLLGDWFAERTRAAAYREAAAHLTQAERLAEALTAAKVAVDSKETP